MEKYLKVGYSLKRFQLERALIEENLQHKTYENLFKEFSTLRLELYDIIS